MYTLLPFCRSLVYVCGGGGGAGVCARAHLSFLAGGGVLHKQSEPVICVSGVGAFLVRQCDLHSPEIIRGLPV